MKKSIFVGLLGLLASFQAQAMPLTGQTASAVMSTFAGTIDTPFGGPAVIGPGPEFTGQFTGAFSQVWDVSLDIGANNFTVAISSPNPNANILSALSALTIDVSGLTGLGPVSLQSYTCTPPGSFACNSFLGSHILSLTSDSTSMEVQFDGLHNGDEYVFAVPTPPSVPEPASVVALIGGLGMLSVFRRKKAQANL